MKKKVYKTKGTTRLIVKEPFAEYLSNSKSEIVIYKTAGSEAQVEVKFEDETVWLTQKQMAQLFQTTPQNITLHLKKVYSEKEVQEKATCKEYLQVQMEGKRRVQRAQLMYNLDASLSVGYRVNSKRGTQFRQWATQRLKDYLVQGYAINQKRLDQLQKVIEVIQQSGKIEGVQLAEAKGLLDILSSYTQSFILLNQYDSHDLHTEKLSEHITYEIEYREAHAAINELKKRPDLHKYYLKPAELLARLG